MVVPKLQMSGRCSFYDVHIAEYLMNRYMQTAQHQLFCCCASQHQAQTPVCFISLALITKLEEL